MAPGQAPSSQNPTCCSQLPWPATPPSTEAPLTAGPKPWKYGNMHLNCWEEKVTACLRAPTMAFCPCHNSSCKEQRRHLFSGTTEQIICRLQINRYLQTRPVIKGCLNHLPYFLQEVELIVWERVINWLYCLRGCFRAQSCFLSLLMPPIISTPLAMGMFPAGLQPGVVYKNVWYLLLSAFNKQPLFPPHSITPTEASSD